MKFNKTYQVILKGGQMVTLDPCSAINILCKELESFKQKEFMEQVLNDLQVIDMTTIEKNDFLNRFYLTYKTILKTQLNEKIKLLTLLFVKSIKLYSEINNDKFELFIKIIDNLTYSEFIILKMLCEKEKYLKISQTDNAKITKKAYEEIKETLNINEELLIAYICRLKGQGLIEITDVFADDSALEELNCGPISQLFKDLVEFIEKQG